MRSWWNVCIVWPFILGGCLCWYGASADLESAQHERVALAEISSTHFDNRNRYGYRFAVNGLLYSGHGNREGVALPTGTEITVHYDTRDPRKNFIAGSFTEMAGSEQAFAIGCWILSAIIAAGIALVVKHNRRVARGQPNIYP